VKRSDVLGQKSANGGFESGAGNVADTCVINQANDDEDGTGKLKERAELAKDVGDLHLLTTTAETVAPHLRTSVILL
jgi:hypothetical protein